MYLAMYAAERSTLVASLPEKAPPPCAHLRVPKRIDTVVISAQHNTKVTQEQLAEDIKKHVICAILPLQLLDKNTKYFINPTGRFEIGGPGFDFYKYFFKSSVLVSLSQGRPFFPKCP